MSSIHSYLHGPLHHRDTTSDIAHTLTAALTHHIQTPTSSYECCIKTNIKRMTLELMQRVWLLLIAGLRSDKLLINEDWLIDWGFRTGRKSVKDSHQSHVMTMRIVAVSQHTAAKHCLDLVQSFRYTRDVAKRLHWKRRFRMFDRTSVYRIIGHVGHESLVHWVTAPFTWVTAVSSDPKAIMTTGWR